jgi:hypothetical protein
LRISIALQDFELVPPLGGDRGAAGADIGLRPGVGRRGLLEPLPRAGFGLRQRLLAILLLPRLDLLRFRRRERRFGLGDRGVLQLDPVVQIVERRLRADDSGFGLRDLRLLD